MEAKDRIIVALDVSNLREVKSLVEQLAPYVGCFKIGLELISSIGGPQAAIYVHKLGGEVFYDGKFNDIPNTVAGAARAVKRMGVKMFNIHCLSGFEAMRRAREAVDTAIPVDETIMIGRKILHTNSLVLGVTILTSLDYQGLYSMDIVPRINYADFEEQKEAEHKQIQELVKNLALLAQDASLDGVVCSPKEISLLRRWCQPEFLLVTPGVRPEWAGKDDQKRVMNPAEAIKAGADYVVIGRPITNPPKEIGSPVEAIKRIITEIEEVK